MSTTYLLPNQRPNLLDIVGRGINAYVFYDDNRAHGGKILLGGLLSALYAKDLILGEYNAKLITSIISLHAIPTSVYVNTNQPLSGYYIGSEFLPIQDTSTYCAYHPHNRFKRFSEVFLTIPSQYNNYFDYPPYTRVVLHLPFIGDKEIDHTPFMQQSDDDKGKIKLWWQVDLYTGDTVCYVCDVDNNVHYTFTGNCAIRFPVTGADYSRQAQGLASILTGAGMMVGGAVTGSAPMIIGGGASMISGTVAQYQGARTMISGSLAGSLGYMGVLNSYMTITRPKFENSDYAQGYPVKGYPCHKYTTLANRSGFTKIANINLKDFTGQQNEYNECVALLKEGVIL